MHPRRFEAKLKQLNRNLNVRRHWSRFTRGDGLYLGQKYLYTVPSGHIYPDMIDSYYGTYESIPHRSLKALFKLIRNEDIIGVRPYLLHWFLRW